MLATLVLLAGLGQYQTVYVPEVRTRTVVETVVSEEKETVFVPYRLVPVEEAERVRFRGLRRIRERLTIKYKAR